MPEEKKANIEEIKRAASIVGSPTRLAWALEVSYNTVYSWMNGKFAPDPINCLKIQKVTKGQVQARDILPNYEWDKIL